MARQRLTIQYVKSPLWRVAPATGVTLTGLTTPSAKDLILRFTHEWIDALNESYDVEVDQKAGTTTVVGPATYSQTPLQKMEEVAVRMTADSAALIALAILGQWNLFSDEMKKRLRDEVPKTMQP